MKRLWWITAAIVAVFALAGLALWLLRPVVPVGIMKQADFIAIYPQGAGIDIDVNSYKYDPKLGQLSYIVKYQGRSITFAEQSTPDQFSDIPDYYPKLMDKMNSYDSFENAAGKVYLTRPTEVKNQVAALSTKGTLVFAQSDGDLDAAAWKRLFASLGYQQPQ